MEQTATLYVDMPIWSKPIAVDDFVVSVGRTKSNSVYLVASVRAVPREAERVTRYHLKVYRSDLLTCIRRDPEQRVITLRWYTREKKA